VARTVYRTYVDESGVRSLSATSGDHFMLSAVIVPDAREANARAALARLRVDLGLPLTAELHFNELKTHSRRLHASQVIGGLGFVTISHVIVCKRHFGLAFLNDPTKAYLFTLRFLLERISWWVRDHGGQTHVTFAHIKGFKVADLHAYVARLQAMGTETSIDWGSILLPVRMDQPKTIELLQMADLVASSVGRAFEPDEFGNTERRYLLELASRLYRRGGSPITTYGMKLHPRSALTDPAYSWVAGV